MQKPTVFALDFMNAASSIVRTNKN